MLLTPKCTSLHKIDVEVVSIIFLEHLFLDQFSVKMNLHSLRTLLFLYHVRCEPSAGVLAKVKLSLILSPRRTVLLISDTYTTGLARTSRLPSAEL